MTTGRVRSQLGAVDLSDGTTFANGFPHELFDALRHTAPVAWHPPTSKTPDGEGFWVVSSYRHVKDVLSAPHLYSSDRGGIHVRGGTGMKDEASAGRMLNQTDDPQHFRLRNLVSRGFTPKAIASIEGQIGDLCERLFAPVGRNQFDFVNAVARELPSRPSA